MSQTHTILVFGSVEIVEDLQLALPRYTARVVHADNQVEALSAAPGADLVVIDDSRSAASSLTEALKQSPGTSGIPLLLHTTGSPDPVPAGYHAAVAAHDSVALISVIQRLLPGTRSAVPQPDEVLGDAEQFDDSDAVTRFRRPAGAEDTGSWPPPAPTLRDGQDLIEFAAHYSGYLSSLVEVLEHPAQLGEQEAPRVRGACRQTMGGAEGAIGKVQSGINQALMSKDLTRMKVLSTAKNSLYEKLQQMRRLLSETDSQPAVPAPASPGLDEQPTQVRATPPPAPPAPPTPATATPAPDEPMADADLQAPGTRTSGTRTELPDLGALSGGLKRGQKSALTQQAEAKAARVKAERKAEVVARQRATRAETHTVRPGVTGSARRTTADEPSGRVWLLVALLILGAVGGGVVYWVSRSRVATQSDTTPNARPVMKRAELAQTPVGIIARPHATDPDKDRISFSFTWKVNGLQVNASTGRLPMDDYKVGDTVVVIVRPQDGYGPGEAMQSQPLKVTLRPRRPTAGQAAAGQPAAKVATPDSPPKINLSPPPPPAP